MKKLILIILTILSISGFSQTKNFIDQNFIEVTGKAEMEIIPNEIYLTIVLNEKDFKGKEDLQIIEQSLINKLKEIGINTSENLAVKDMVSNFKDYWIKSKEIKTSKVYQLKVTNAEMAGKVFQELELLGISNINVERVEHSEILDYKQKVKIAAIKAAKTKADSLTKAIDQSCGRAIYIQELNHQIYSGLNRTSTSNIMVREVNNLIQSNKEFEIEFKSIKLEYAILVRFELN